MKQSDVPFYNDPTDFETLGDSAKYPCSTQYMVYNALLHRYSLTNEGLLHYGINAVRNYISDNPAKIQELIDKTSKKVYDAIQYKAGRQCYQIQMYRIAAAPKIIYPDQYFMRKQFEEALADQARFIVENGDAARFSGGGIEKPANAPLKPEDDMRDLSDVAPETLRTLEVLGLLRWFRPEGIIRLDLSKY